MKTYTEEEIRDVLGRYLADWLVDDLVKELTEIRQLRDEPAAGDGE